MSWWTSSLDLEASKKFNLAARWLLRQSGTVRQRGEEFTPEELAYQKEITHKDPETGELMVLTEEHPLAGINKLMAALEQMNGLTSLDKRGELRSQFYLTLSRKPGERVADFATRYRTSVADMKAEGIVLRDGELGWWLKEKLGLDALRKQLLDTALAGAEGFNVIEAEILRLFRDLRLQDPLLRRLERANGPKLTIRRMFGPPASSSTISSAGTSTTPSRRSSFSTASSAAPAHP